MCRISPASAARACFAGAHLAALLFLIVLALLPRPAAAQFQRSSCKPADILLVHPARAADYAAVFRDIAEGIESGYRGSVSICSVDDASLKSKEFSPKAIFAVGEQVYTVVVSRFSSNSVTPILVRELPSGATHGVSLYVSPIPILRQLCDLYPSGKDIRAVTLIHRSQTDPVFLRLAREAAKACALSFSARPADDLLDVGAIAGEIMTNPPPGSAFWFHDDVIRINPGLLVPNITRLSWTAAVPVIADQADYVKRGLLVASFHDYRGLGKLCATFLAKKPVGMVFSTAVKSVLNMRTARAIGLSVRSSKQADFDAVYDW